MLFVAGPHEGAVAASAEGAAQVSAVSVHRLRRTHHHESARCTQRPCERGMYGTLGDGMVRYGTGRYGTVRYHTYNTICMIRYVRYYTILFDTIHFHTIRAILFNMICTIRYFSI